MLALYSRNMLINDIIDRIKLPFRKDKELYSSLYSIIGFYPRNIEYYKLALMHRSAGGRDGRRGRRTNNERLEFLGDAVLDAVVGDIVFRHFIGKREGFLTNTRSKIVQRETLNKLSHEMGIDKLVQHKGGDASHNSYMGGNAFEALVGAIYLDRGYGACMKFMEKRILGHLINIDKVAYKEVNFKSKLLEWCQKNRVQMDFRMLDEKKDDSSSPFFRHQVVMEGVEGCEGSGYSKRESQQMAARLTLQRLRREPQFIDKVFAAKADRTKMEEEPVSTVPDVERKDDFIITSPHGDDTKGAEHPAGDAGVAATSAAATMPNSMLSAGMKAARARTEPSNGEACAVSAMHEMKMSTCDGTAPDADGRSKEDIIAEAETAAFNAERTQA